MLRRCFLLVALTLLAIDLRPATAQLPVGTPPSAATRPATTNPLFALPPKQVYVGVFFNQIEAVSLKDSKVAVDFHVWFRWKDDELKPLDTFDLTNGKIDNKEDIYQTMLPGGWHYAVCRVLATIDKLWDVSDYPVDDHDFTLEIEDSTMEDFKLVYVPDVENCGLNPNARVSGWTLAYRGAAADTHHYNTNYGDISLPAGQGANYSRFVYRLELIRPGYGLCGKLFTGLFIAVFIGFTSLTIRPSELDARFALSVGSLFAAVGSEYIVSASLPDTNYLTLADKLHILSFVFIFLTLIESTISNKLSQKDHRTAARRLDRIAFGVMLTIYVAGIALFLTV